MANNNSWNNQVTNAYNQIILNSGTNGIAVSTDAAAATLSIGTGGAVKTTTLGSTNSTSTTTVQSGSGALNVTATGGALTINSGIGALGISNDASATTLSIGTGAAVKTITLGSTTSTSATTVRSGSGGIKLIGVAGVVVSNKQYVTLNTSTGALGSDTGPSVGTITGNTGGAISQSAGNWNIITAGTNIPFSGSGSTLTLDFSFSPVENIFIGHTGASVAGANTCTSVGIQSLDAVTSGDTNSAFGGYSLSACNTGSANTAIGQSSITQLTSGSQNSALGDSSLFGLISGSRNTALGYNSLPSALGDDLIGIGYSAGDSYNGTESSNIIMFNTGVTGESNTIRIGTSGSGARQQNKCFIAGISGVTVTGAAVIVSASDQLGVLVSARRYKENIRDMGSVSSDILKLRPVTFNMKDSEDRRVSYGLIAEEVHKDMPGLVIYDKAGDPQTVKYHELPALLLNELQKAVKKIAQLEDRINSLEKVRK